MSWLECGFAGREREKIRLCGDLARGWRNLGQFWGFDEQDYLEYGESKFRCRFRVVAKAPDSFSSRKTFPERYVLDPIKVGECSVSLHGLKLELDVSLAQPWRPTNDANRRPSVYEIEEDAFIVRTPEGDIYYRLQVWLVLHGQSKMFVKDEYEWGDGFAWIGGRPESDRSRF
jgi:hypothetical protein